MASVRVADDYLREIAMRVIVRWPGRALTVEAVHRADRILQEDKESRQFTKQEVVHALIKEARLLNDTVPLPFFEPDLRKLSFKGASKISEPLLEAVCGATPALEYLDVSGCFLLGDSAVAAVLAACPGLRSLKMENCRKMTDQAIEHVIKHGKGLQALSLGGNFNMRDEGVRRLVTKHPNRHNLKELYVSGLEVSSETLEAVVTQCPKMRALGLGYSDVLTEQMLLSVVRRLRLRKLHVHWCQQAVTDHVLQVLGEECGELEELNICGVKAVTPQAIQALLQARNGGADGSTAMMEVDESSRSGSGVSSSSSGSKGTGGGSSSSSSKKNGLKRLRRLKIRYVGVSKAPVEAIEEAWGHEVDFPS